MPPTTLYEMLNVTPQATNEEIDVAYQACREAAQGNAERLALLAVAHDTLGHPERRAAYDRRLQRSQTTVEPMPDTRARGPRLARHAGFWIASMLLIAAATVLWFQQRAAFTPPPAVASPHSATPVTRKTTPPVISTAPALSAAESVATLAPLPEPVTPPVERETGGGQVTLIVPTRGAKTSEFDARYLSWSVFHVNQRNKRGSGVLIGTDRILTNCHVLAGGASNDLVVVHSVTGRLTKVEKYARLDDEDACLLFAPGAGDDTIAWGSSSSLAVGDPLHTFGHPGGSPEIIWSTGRLLARLQIKGETFLFSNNVCLPGSSGGPVLDDNGRLVGIVMATRYFQSKAGEPPQYRDCIAVTEATARALLSRPLFPIALAPAQFLR